MPHDDRGISSFNRQNEPSEPTGKSYLLAIGINEYVAFSKLKNAVKDVQDVADLLANRFGFERQSPFSHFLLDEKASRRNIINSLENLCDLLQPEDRALIFYSGHGYLNPRTKHGFWIPADAEQGDIASYLPNTTLRDYIKAMPCRHILLVSDSCFSQNLIVREASRGTDGAFADWEKQRSRWVFCSGKGVVSDGVAGKNSPFAAEFLRSLREHKTSEPLNAAQLADRVTRGVGYNYEQQAEASPLFGVGHEGGQFIFYPQKNEVEEWQAALAANTDAAFIAFLKNHPAGQLANEAHQRLADFEQQRQQQAHEDAYRRASQTPHSIRLLSDFLEKYPASPHKSEIRSLLRDAEEEQTWRRVNKNSLAALDEYLEEVPYGKYAAEARRRIGEIRYARQKEEDTEQQAALEKQTLTDLAAKQVAKQKQQQADESKKKKEAEDKRVRKAEDQRQQQATTTLRQQEEVRLRHEEEEQKKKLAAADGGTGDRGIKWLIPAGVATAVLGLVAIVCWLASTSYKSSQNATQLGGDSNILNQNIPIDSLKSFQKPSNSKIPSTSQTLPKSTKKKTGQSNNDTEKIDSSFQADTNKTEDSAAIVLKEKQDREAAAKAKAERDYKALKDQIGGGALGGGKGKGNSGKSSNSGDPNGDPNSDILTGISTGSGTVGGGLSNRGVLKKGSPITDTSQDEGTIFLDVCVDKNGGVVSAEFTTRGSSTNSERLKRLAIQNAKQWKFKTGEVDKQCGTIRYDFKLK